MSTYHIKNASVSSIGVDCVKGHRNVSVRIGAKYDAGFMSTTSIDVWVSEEIVDINEIKQEAMRLAKSFAADVAVSDCLSSGERETERQVETLEAFEPPSDPGY